MDKFVVGFAFSANKQRILLVKKKRPEWQKGFLNGIVGKIEPGEKPISAMIRESKEEAGLSLPWKWRGKMSGQNNDGRDFECHIFYAYSDDIEDYEQIEDEPLGLYEPLSCIGANVITNLSFLIPYGLFNDGSRAIYLDYRN